MLIKFAVALLLFSVKSSSVLGDDENMMACVELLKPEYQECCENLENIDKYLEDDKECSKKESSEELTCGELECVMNKHSLLDNGKIINDKTKEFLDGIAKDHPKEKNIIDLVKEQCLDEKYVEYALEDECKALGFYICLYTNIMVGCESWKSTAVCKKASDLAKKCQEAK